jgi:hypothetical protein
MGVDLIESSVDAMTISHTQGICLKVETLHGSVGCQSSISTPTLVPTAVTSSSSSFSLSFFKVLTQTHLHPPSLLPLFLERGLKN